LRGAGVCYGYGSLRICGILFNPIGVNKKDLSFFPVWIGDTPLTPHKRLGKKFLSFFDKVTDYKYPEWDAM